MSEHAHAAPAADAGFSSTPTLIAVAVILAAYGISLAMNWPQQATALIAAASSGAGHADDHAAPAHPKTGHDEPGHAETGHGEASHEEHGSASHGKFEPPALFWAAPFCLLLGAIALFPLLHATEHWWEDNLHKLYVAGGLGAITMLYYLVLHGHPVDRHFITHAVAHPAPGGLNIDIAWTVIQNAMFNEYIPFIVLLFCLYTITGGIRIEGDLRAHPSTNTAFIAIGALLASFVGTTGAAMVLIRPLLETNAERRNIAHTVVFFIFAVCNCGGCLLPIGDPPLFLGYLSGVPFLWTLGLWKQWIFVNGLLLVVYFLWDTFIAYPRETKRDIVRDETQVKPLTFSGLINVLWLFLVIVSVGILDPSKKLLEGTPLQVDWHPWLYLREVMQFALVGASLLTTPKPVRNANKFNYGAIIEVAALFIGIFICMQPALQYLDAYGQTLGLKSSVQFFWATGILSSVLDNAPTYLVFFKTAGALDKAPDAVVVAGVEESLLVAVSLGAVFMGAMTYIGNGPNFMVKAIAEKSGVRMPSFFGYMLYSFGVLLPILVLNVYIFG